LPDLLPNPKHRSAFKAPLAALAASFALGIVGALVGGFIGFQLGFGDISGFDLRSMLLAVGGGVLVLFLYGLATRGHA